MFRKQGKLEKYIGKVPKLRSYLLFKNEMQLRQMSIR